MKNKLDIGGVMMPPAGWLVMAGIIIAGIRGASARADDTIKSFVIADGGGAVITEDSDSDAVTNQRNHKIVIRQIDAGSDNADTRPVTWLGVSSEDVPEALSEQLGLKHGEGMVINYVSKDSPAARAGLRKNDVLVGFDDQMLVDPAQLRKLVRMHAEGDTVKIAFCRGGKKQTVTAKLEKKALTDSMPQLGQSVHDLQVSLSGLDGAKDSMKEQMDALALARSMAKAGVDKERMKIELQQTMEQTRKAIQDAIRNSHDTADASRALRSASRELEKLAGKGVAVGDDTTVVVTSEGKQARSMVQSDDTGSYVIVADPKKRLTVHDKQGKLLFDGPVESAGDRERVPKKIWAKVKPMLSQMDRGEIQFDTPAAPATPANPPADSEKP